MSLTIEMPLYVDLPRRKGPPKRVHLNLNAYRNLHHHTSNDAKHTAKELVWSQLRLLDPGYSLRTPVELTVTLYAPDKKERDLGNVCSIAQKFVDDAVVEYGLLPDDNLKYLKRIIYAYGGVCRENPRFELTYKEI